MKHCIGSDVKHCIGSDVKHCIGSDVKHCIGCVSHVVAVSLEDTVRCEAENSPGGFQAPEAAACGSEISRAFCIFFRG